MSHRIMRKLGLSILAGLVASGFCATGSSQAGILESEEYPGTGIDGPPPPDHGGDGGNTEEDLILLRPTPRDPLGKVEFGASNHESDAVAGSPLPSWLARVIEWLGVTR